jgi:4-hydroxy-2-oxoheptanedioate aldolase
MRENKLRTIWKNGGAVINGWLHIANSYATETMAHQKWDSLTVDMQHGPVDFQSALSMLQAISTTDVVPMARVPWNEPGVIMRMLDVGCYGIICPMINSRAEAEAFVGACRYPPHGYRSMGPNRVVLYAGADYAANANDTVVTMAMIETAEAVQNLDEILSVPGLDAIYIGPSDLSQSLGFAPRVDPTEPKVVETVDHILAGCRKHGIIAGMHTGAPAYAKQMIEKGVQFVTIGSDARLMAAAASAVVAEMKGGKKELETQKGPY